MLNLSTDNSLQACFIQLKELDTKNTHGGVDLRTNTMIWRFPAKKFPQNRIFCLFRVNRIPFILFILISEQKYRLFWLSVHIPEYSQKNAPTELKEQDIKMSYLFTMAILHFLQNKMAFFMKLLVLLFIVLITKVTSRPVADGDDGYSIGGDVDELTSADGSGAGNSGADGSGSDGSLNIWAMIGISATGK